jgi:CRISPR-associated protein Cas1
MHDRKLLRGTYPALALDYMEPMRPVVDRAILQLIEHETFTGADFTIQDNGVCRLNPELAPVWLRLCHSTPPDARRTSF